MSIQCGCPWDCPQRTLRDIQLAIFRRTACELWQSQDGVAIQRGKWCCDSRSAFFFWPAAPAFGGGDETSSSRKLSVVDTSGPARACDPDMDLEGLFG